MTTSNTKTTTRMVVASFAAGAGAMVLLGLVAPVIMKGGPLIREAFAAEVTQTNPVIEPLNVEAIEAQLADADRLMVDDIARLQRLTPR